MSFLPYDPFDTVSGTESFQSSSPQDTGTSFPLLHVPRQKLRIPDHEGGIDRPRVEEALRNSLEQFPATVVCGRSGTGKTAAVATFVSRRSRAAWNSLEPPDIHWATFANSTLAAIRGNASNRKRRPSEELIERPEAKDISKFVDLLFASERGRRELIVFDNVHYVFDTSWFREFFELLLPAIPRPGHVIFISRSKPPFPLWRMRSKQFINLIEEKVFAFDESETAELFRKNGFPEELVPVAHQNCFGKVSHMLRFAEAAME